MKTVVITAGGTSEKIDNVRKITNSSTGKLGKVIANELIREVPDIKIYYICSKSSLRPINKNIEIIEIDGTLDLKTKVENLLKNNKIDYFIHSMAVSDYMVDYVTTAQKLASEIESSNYSTLDTITKFNNGFNENKISSHKNNLIIMLKRTPKIISIIKKISPKTFLVGFKLLDGVTKDKLINTAKKLRDKNKCDLVVANDLSNIRNGNHIAYIIDNQDIIITANDKVDIAKNLVLKLTT